MSGLKNINQLTESVKASQRSQTGPQENISRHSPQLMVMTWRSLKAMGLVHTEVGETDYKYWAHSLMEFTDGQLADGIAKAKDHKGYLTLGVFRDMCRPEKKHASHETYLALPSGQTLESRLRHREKFRENMREIGVVYAGNKTEEAA